jgi:hypothetical protein|tara:strand:+ start:715 stop:1182 length:468 start_codon:yes stop_codon:yes gene_type:complete
MIQNDIKDLLTTAKDMLRENIDTVPAHGCRREEVLEVVTQIENIIIAHGINIQGAFEIECKPVSIRRCSIYVDWEIETDEFGHTVHKESYYCRQPAVWYTKPFSDELNIYWCTEHKDYSEGSEFISNRYDPDQVFFDLELTQVPVDMDSFGDKIR